MKKLFIYTLSIGFILFSIQGCYYDKAELVYSQQPTCDTANMTYTKNIVPIVEGKCYSCHGGTASGSFGINLDSYAELSAVAKNGELMHRITTTDPSEMMPKGGPRLSDCEISKINSWIQNGTPN